VDFDFDACHAVEPHILLRCIHPHAAPRSRQIYYSLQSAPHRLAKMSVPGGRASLEAIDASLRDVVSEAEK